MKEQYDTSCYAAASDMFSRDASCRGDLVCARPGFDNRAVGDCPQDHCCSVQVRDRFDTTCWQAGKDLFSRDASCKGELVCARRGHDGRQFGDCPGRHCCSVETNPNKAIYAVGDDGNVYKQVLSSMSESSVWKLVGKGPMRSLAINGDRIYAVGTDHQLYFQALSTMSKSTDWTLAQRKDWTLAAAEGKLLSIAFHGETIYGVGADKKVYKQSVSRMTNVNVFESNDWSLAGKGLVTSVAISGDTIYATKPDHLVYKQTLSTMSQGEWTVAGAGYVKSVAVDGDTIYGTGINKRVWRQPLTGMTTSSHWSLAGSGDVIAVAITPNADTGAKVSLQASASKLQAQRTQQALVGRTVASSMNVNQTLPQK